MFSSDDFESIYNDPSVLMVEATPETIKNGESIQAMIRKRGMSRIEMVPLLADDLDIKTILGRKINLGILVATILGGVHTELSDAVLKAVARVTKTTIE
jgi:hypothetical protein